MRSTSSGSIKHHGVQWMAALFLLGGSAVFAQIGKNADCIVHDNADYSSENLRFAYTGYATAQDCADWCSSETDCTHWTHVGPSDAIMNDPEAQKEEACYLKQAMGQRNDASEEDRKTKKLTSGNRKCGTLKSAGEGFKPRQFGAPCASKNLRWIPRPRLASSVGQDDKVANASSSGEGDLMVPAVPAAAKLEEEKQPEPQMQWMWPDATWKDCEETCNGRGCTHWHFVPPYCLIQREEADKGWPAQNVFSVSATTEQECATMCEKEEVECNSGWELRGPRCFMWRLEDATPVKDHNWIDGYWGGSSLGGCEEGLYVPASSLCNPSSVDQELKKLDASSSTMASEDAVNENDPANLPQVPKTRRRMQSRTASGSLESPTDAKDPSLAPTPSDPAEASASENPMDPALPRWIDSPLETDITGTKKAYRTSQRMCYRIALERLTAPEAQAACEKEGGTLLEVRTQQQNDAVLSLFCPPELKGECRVPRGEILDGVFFMGLYSPTPGKLDTWEWGLPMYTGKETAKAGEANPNKALINRFGGQGENAPLFYSEWPSVQPDNTSKNQSCAYYYPRDFPSGKPNGGWGDEDCEGHCQVPPSKSVQDKGPSILSAGGGVTCSSVADDNVKGLVMPVRRRFICQATVYGRRNAVFGGTQGAKGEEEEFFDEVEETTAEPVDGDEPSGQVTSSDAKDVGKDTAEKSPAKKAGSSDTTVGDGEVKAAAADAVPADLATPTDAARDTDADGGAEAGADSKSDGPVKKNSLSDGGDGVVRAGVNDDDASTRSENSSAATEKRRDGRDRSEVNDEADGVGGSAAAGDTAKTLARNAGKDESSSVSDEVEADKKEELPSSRNTEDQRTPKDPTSPSSPSSKEKEEKKEDKKRKENMANIRGGEDDDDAALAGSGWDSDDDVSKSSQDVESLAFPTPEDKVTPIMVSIPVTASATQTKMMLNFPKDQAQKGARRWMAARLNIPEDAIMNLRLHPLADPYVPLSQSGSSSSPSKRSKTSPDADDILMLSAEIDQKAIDNSYPNRDAFIEVWDAKVVNGMPNMISSLQQQAHVTSKSTGGVGNDGEMNTELDGGLEEGNVSDLLGLWILLGCLGVLLIAGGLFGSIVMMRRQQHPKKTDAPNDVGEGMFTPQALASNT